MKTKEMFKLLANYYALYIKTHSYHWNISGDNFSSLHKMLDDQYKVIAEQIDGLAERIRILGEKVPATLTKFATLSEISEPDETLNWKEMLTDLHKSNIKIVEMMYEVLELYSQKNDVVTVDLLTEYIASRQKDIWFLSASTI